MKYYKYEIDREYWTYNYVIEFNIVSHNIAKCEFTEILNYFGNELKSANHVFYYPEKFMLESIIDYGWCPNIFLILMKNIEDINMLLMNLSNEGLKNKVYKINKERIS